MLIVIFRARIKQLDEQYSATAERMRELALREFGCVAFHAVTEGQDEVALSYWPDEHHIQAWKAHPEHIAAQKLGQTKWYESYSVEVARIERSYQMPTNPSFQRTASVLPSGPAIDGTRAPAAHSHAREQPDP